MSKKITIDGLRSGGTPISCRVSDGKLTVGYKPALKNNNAPSGMVFAAYAQGIHYFFVINASQLYISTNSTTFTSLSTFTNGSNAFLAETIDNNEPCAIIVSGSSGLLRRPRTFRNFSFNGAIKCGVFFKSRLFGIAENSDYTIRWSGEGNFNDWEEKLYGSGSLLLDTPRGAIRQLIVFRGKLVAVRRFGLTVLNVNGFPENFSVETTDTDTPEITDKTACVVGDELVFYTSKGIMYFDGSKIHKSTGKIRGSLSMIRRAASWNGLYFLHCRSSFLPRYVILCYDPNDDYTYFIDFAPVAMAASQIDLFCYTDGGVYDMRVADEFSYEGNEENFGVSGYKTVEKIEIDSDGVDLEISNGKVTRVFKSAKGLIRPRLRGESFTIKLSGANDVRSLTMTAEVMDGI